MSNGVPVKVIALAGFVSSLIFGQGGLSITHYQVVNQVVYNPTQSVVTYRADVVNAGGTVYSSVAATATSLDPFTIRIVSGQDMLNFAPVPANSQVTSSNTFSIMVLGSGTPDLTKLQWSFQLNAKPVIANAGPNQTATVGSTVTLNGSGSSNPSGVGTLSYSWVFVVRPAGTTTRLMNSTTPFPSFVVDVPGTYTMALTVTNGVASDTATVMVSTNHTPPVANAGPNQTVAVGGTAVLDGSGSSDSDGAPLTYAWSFVSRPLGSTATLTGTNTVSPTFVVDVAGTYMVQLVVTDDFTSSAPSTVTITTQAVPPVANAGPNQQVAKGSVVQLDGSKSTDSNGHPLTYAWTFLSRPSGSASTLSNPTIVNPTFTADLAGSYIVQLVVNDGSLNSAPATVAITTLAVLAPTANAGTNQYALPGTTVTLNGSGTDPQNFPLTYKWTLLSKPVGSNASLSNPAIPNPTFLVDQSGTYVAQLIVNNGFLDSPASTTTVSTNCAQPTANAGPNQTVLLNATVALNGSASSGACQGGLTYQWSLTTAPGGSAATLSGANTVSPAFVADVAGTYVAQLIVNNGLTNSNPATVTVTAIAASSAGFVPSQLSLSRTPGTTTMLLGSPAGPGGLIVTLISSNPNIATVPASVTIPQGSKIANITVTPGNTGGEAIITAMVSGLALGSFTVDVTLPTLNLAPDHPSVGVTRTVNVTITLSASAPAGGLSVSLAASPGGIISLPDSVMISAGSTLGTFTVTGVAPGSATITANAVGYTGSATTLTVSYIAIIQLPSVPVTVGPNQSVPFSVSLATGAPIGGLTINLVSSDPTKVTVTPSVFIPFAATTPASPAQVTGVGFGSATITASVAGAQSVSQTVQVGGTLGFSPTSLIIPSTGTGILTLTLSSPAPAGGVPVNLSSTNPAAATVPATVTIPANATSAPVVVTGVAAGSTVIHASSLPFLADTTASIAVAVYAIQAPATTTVSVGQSAAFPLSLSIPAIPNDVTVTLASSDTTIVTVTPSVVVPKPSTQPASSPQITGIGLGSATITMTAPGYQSAQMVVQTTATVSFPPGIQNISPGVQNLTLTLSIPAPASGLTINLSSSNTLVATVPATVMFAPHATTVNVPVTGVGAGTAVIQASALPNIPAATVTVTLPAIGSILPPAVTAVATGQTVAFPITLSVAAPTNTTVMLTSTDTSKLTVSTSSVTILAGHTTPTLTPQITGIGVGSASVMAVATAWTGFSQLIQVTASPILLSFSPSSLSINAPATQNLTLLLSAAPSSALTISLSSSNPAVATVPASVPVSAGATSVLVPVTGVAAGNTTITASATGVASASASITVLSAAIILPANVVVQPGQTVSFPVTLATPAPSGGLFVSLTNSDTSKVTLQPLNFIIPGGQTSATFTPQLTGVALGSVTITASSFGLPSASTTVVVGISSSPLTMSFSPPTLAIAPGNAQNVTLNLSGPAPSALTLNISSSNTAAVTVPANVTIPANGTSTSVLVTGVAVGSATITASVTGIPSTTANITVSTSAAAIQLPANVTLFPGQTSDFPVTLAAPAGAGGVLVALSSTDTSKVTITPTNLFIPQGATTTSVAPKVTGVSLGSASINASAFGLGSATQQVQVALTLSFPAGTRTVLKNTTPGITLTLSGPAPSGGLTVNLSSSDSSIASVPASVTFAQGATSAIVPVTGIATGGPVTITASAPGITGATATVMVATAPAIILPVYDSLGDGTAQFPVSLSAPAPAGGVTVTLTSSDTTNFTITPSIFFPAGATTPSSPALLTNINHEPILGNSLITATAPGYTPASLRIYQSDSVTITKPANLTVGLGQSAPLPFALPVPAPAGGLTVILSSSDPTTISVQTTSVFIGAGKNLPDVPPLITGLKFGSASIKQSALTYTWDNSPIQVVATLSFSPSPLTLSGSITGTLTLTLSGAAPAGGLTVNLGSNNTAVASVPSSVVIPQGATSVTVPVTGFGTGQATITASPVASGVPMSTVTVLRQ